MGEPNADFVCPDKSGWAVILGPANWRLRGSHSRQSGRPNLIVMERRGRGPTADASGDVGRDEPATFRVSGKLGRHVVASSATFTRTNVPHYRSLPATMPSRERDPDPCISPVVVV